MNFCNTCKICDDNCKQSDIDTAFIATNFEEEDMDEVENDIFDLKESTSMTRLAEVSEDSYSLLAAPSGVEPTPAL